MHGRVFLCPGTTGRSSKSCMLRCLIVGIRASSWFSYSFPCGTFTFTWFHMVCLQCTPYMNGRWFCLHLRVCHVCQAMLHTFCNNSNTNIINSVVRHSETLFFSMDILWTLFLPRSGWPSVVYLWRIWVDFLTKDMPHWRLWIGL